MLYRYPIAAALLAGLSLPALGESQTLDFLLAPANASQNTLSISVGAEVRNVPVFGTVSDSDSDSSTVSGNVLANLDIDFLADGSVDMVNNISFAGGRVQFDEDLAFNLSFVLGLGTVDATGTDLAGQLQTLGPAAVVDAGGEFDLALSEILINEGQLTAVGGGAASGVNETFDFNTTPLPAPLVGAASIGVTLDSVVGGVATYTATLTAPVSFAQSIDVDADTTVSVSATGNLIATNTFTRILGTPGDLDGDGFVGVSDLDLVLADWGTSGSPADADGSGTVGQGDLDIVIANWGDGTPPGTVPEPGALALLAVGGLALVRRRRR